MFHLRVIPAEAAQDLFRAGGAPEVRTEGARVIRAGDIDILTHPLLKRRNVICGIPAQAAPKLTSTPATLLRHGPPVSLLAGVVGPRRAQYRSGRRRVDTIRLLCLQ